MIITTTTKEGLINYILWMMSICIISYLKNYIILGQVQYT